MASAASTYKNSRDADPVSLRNDMRRLRAPLQPWSGIKSSPRAGLVIPTVAIDELVDQGDLTYPRFVKIDVEGAEGFRVTGHASDLVAAEPALFVECSEAGRETSWQLLCELGYRRQSAITLNGVSDFDEFRHSDFLWLPPIDLEPIGINCLRTVVGLVAHYIYAATYPNSSA